MNNKHIYDCIIIGGGASGLMCGAAFTAPIDGLILEGSPRLGTKLLMAGGGHCNITHSGTIKEFITRYGETGKRFRKPLYKYSNDFMIEFLESHGVPVITDDDGRVLPASEKSSDILNLYVSLCQNNNFHIHTDSRVTAITPLIEGVAVSIQEAMDLSDVLLNKKTRSELNAQAQAPSLSGCDSPKLTWKLSTESGNYYIARNIVIATGGCSYPKTGSDGSMHEIMRRDLALNITELTPALAPIRLQDYPYAELAGITLQDVEITIWPPQGKAIKNTGPLLFTHTALSGPVALNISRYALPGGKISLNYTHSQRYEDVLQKLQSAMNQSKQDPANIVCREFDVPKRIARLLASRALGKDGKSISVKKLAQNLTGDTFTIDGTEGFQVAMATRGGVERSQSDPGTMRLAHRAGCFAVGEALDVDGETGGYNLQFAFSSAFTAARAIEESL